MFIFVCNFTYLILIFKERVSLFYTYSSLVMLFFSIIKFKHAAKTVPILVYYTEIGHLSN